MSEEEQIADFIARRGVTRCPAAIAAPTTVDVRPEDAAAHAARGPDPAREAWHARRNFGWTKSQERAAAKKRASARSAGAGKHA